MSNVSQGLGDTASGAGQSVRTGLSGDGGGRGQSGSGSGSGSTQSVGQGQKQTAENPLGLDQ